VVAGYNRKIAELEEESRQTAQWAANAQKEIAGLSGDLAAAVAALERVEKELEDRTVWAQRLDREKAVVEGQLAMVRLSRWVKLGRKVGLGPAV